MNIRAPNIIELLIVEDDEDDYVLTSALLRQADSFDFHIDWVRDPLQARKTFSENRHDICLMDYRLGSEVSISLVREAPTLGFTAPIIMLTGQDDSGVEIEAAAAGAVDYLIKDNLGREQLLRAIRYALARSEIQAERVERIRAEAASRSKSEFLAILSHEIRTPLTAIIGYTELLIHRHQRNDADLADKLQIINRNGSHLLSLLNDTLDLSKIEAGKLETDIEKIELGPFVMNTISLIREMAEAKHLTLQISAGTPLPRYIYSDAMRLRQVLFNLLGNAIKFTEVGTVELQVKMDGKCLEFHVIDTGRGLSRGDLEKIFTPFTQLMQNRKEGTGLGLSISQKLAQKLGGSITAHSIEGGGSRFIVRIDPGEISLDETAELVPLPEKVATHIEHGEVITGSIIVADDVEDIRDLISNILTQAGIQVLMANNGQEALDLLDAHGADIAMVLLDLNMPVLNGYQALQQMRERGYKIPIIALTAASLRGEREKCLAAGFTSYLTKPVTASVLLGEIDKQAQQSAPSVNTMETTDILVVEDNEDANAAICMLLQMLGHDVRGAFNAAAALQMFNEKTPTLVFADLGLGDCDGVGLLQQLHALEPDVRYFVLSGNDPARQQLPDYIEGFIPKPVTLDTLTAALNRRRAA
jgi:two-component system, sensor histidine kinase and response regulator